MQDEIQTTFGVITVDNKYTELKAAINTNEDYLRGDFLVAVADRPSYDVEHEVRQLLLAHYYTADVTVAVHEKHNGIFVVWYTAQDRV